MFEMLKIPMDNFFCFFVFFPCRWWRWVIPSYHPYTTDNPFIPCVQSSIMRIPCLFTEFVEVILLPLNEFQMKIDGEAVSQCDISIRTTHQLYHVSFFVSTELLKKEKILVDAKVYIFAMGMVQAFFKPQELPVLKQWSKVRMRERDR